MFTLWSFTSGPLCRVYIPTALGRWKMEEVQVCSFDPGTVLNALSDCYSLIRCCGPWNSLVWTMGWAQGKPGKTIEGHQTEEAIVQMFQKTPTNFNSQDTSKSVCGSHQLQAINFIIMFHKYITVKGKKRQKVSPHIPASHNHCYL